MNYEQFIRAMIECTNEKLSENAYAMRQEILKNNGVRTVGVAIRKKEESVAPLIYLEEFYKKYLMGVSVETLAEELIGVSEAAPSAPDWDYRKMLDFHQVKHQIVYKLIHGSENQQLLQEVPNLPIMDLVIIFYVLVPNAGGESCSIMIRNEHMEQWKTPISLIYEYAKRNTPMLCPCRFGPLDAFLHEMSEECDLFVLTNEQGQNGASAILYEGVPEMICEAVGGNYYLIPSSIHEFIIVPDRGKAVPEELQTMLLNTNEAEVAAEEVLSDHIYYFDGDIITRMP